MTDAWGYVRLSGRSGDSSEAGLDVQKKSIREYSRANEINLQTTRNDGERTSGFNEDRHEYQLLRGKVEEGDIDAVVTRDRARMSRRFDERLWLIQTMRERGVEWHVVEAGGSLGLDDVQNAGIECLHAMMDHTKKMVEIERSKQATRERRERGCYEGMPPFGLRFHDDGCHLVRDSDEWPKMIEIFGADEKTYAAVADATGVDYDTTRRVKKRGVNGYDRLLREYGHPSMEKPEW